MACTQAITLIEPTTGAYWTLFVDEGGNMHTIQGAIEPYVFVILHGGDGFDYLLMADVNGRPVGVPVETRGVPYFLLRDSDCEAVWKIEMLTSDQLKISFVDFVETFQIGELYPHAEGYPQFAQPGGIGTQTFPQQQNGGTGMVWINGVPNEIGQGMWTAGCGHWFNSWEIISVTGCCSPVALICCPLCRFIQQIITPYIAIQDPVSNPIIFG